MKAFLSHSSLDKSYVEKVANLLRPGTYELDSLTFEKGEMSTAEIISALKRSDLFCLFLSKHSANSNYVDLEKRLSVELLGAGKIKNLLTICLDNESFELLGENLGFFNAARKALSPEAAAHLITGKQISTAKNNEQRNHPFVGREKELRRLEDQALDFERPKIRALFLSGNSGVGRRSIAEHFLTKQYPNVIPSYPTIEVESYAGYDELYRQFLMELQPSLSISDFVAKAEEFSSFDNWQKARKIADLLNEARKENLVVFICDAGGLLEDSGALSPEMDAVIDLLDGSTHPPTVIISPRMTPSAHRRSLKDVAYVPVGPLTRDDARRLLSWAMRSIDASPNSDQMESLVDVSDRHPYNIYEIKNRLAEIGADAFLADTSSFLAWKHKETSEYFRNTSIDNDEVIILSLLLFAPELDFGTVIQATALDQASTAKIIQRLIDLHVLSYNEDRFSISPPLRIAVERDPRIKAKQVERSEIMNRLARLLKIRFDDGTAPVALADSAVISTLESGGTLDAISAALLLPSHRVWLAKRHYDAGHWSECARLTEDALKDRSRLSSGGFVAAGRLLCLAAARLGNQSLFDSGITKLNSAAQDSWTKAGVCFLKGFNDRIKGKVLDAENHFRRAYDFNGRDRSTARELASIYLIVGDHEKAEKFARLAYELASNNPYTIDILVSALVRSLGPRCVGNIEVDELLSRLEVLDREERRSFSYTRKAEIELLFGDASQAEKHVREAMRITPHLFEPKLLRAKILLKSGNIPAAGDAIKELERLTSRHAASDNKANRRQVLSLKAEYLIETSQFEDARKVFNDRDCFSFEDRDKEIKKIEVAQAFSKSGRK